MKSGEVERQNLLEANQTLQGKIREELRILAQHKANNRSWALYYTQQLRRQHKHQQQEQNIAKPVKSRKRRNHQTEDNTVPSSATNLYGKRQERFFSDLRQSQPAPNPDTIRRRQQLETSTFFYHTQPPWSSSQDQALQAVVTANEQPSSSTDWNHIAVALHMRVPNEPRRTSVECRIQYARHDPTIVDSPWKQLVANLKTNPPANHPWKLPQDELLLKYIAAAGPQHVWDIDSFVRMTAQFFPHKTRQQFFNRIHQSLLNPNFVHDFWTLEEERKLVLLMKFYHEPVPSRQRTVAASGDDDNGATRENNTLAANADSDDDNRVDREIEPCARQNHSSLTLYRASSHFPRNTKSVSDKWNRTLNPEQYTTKPFTSAEKEKLLQIMEEHLTIGWAQLSQQHFPHRHPHRLMLQWFEQATVESFAKREELLQREQSQQNDSTNDPRRQKQSSTTPALASENQPNQRPREI
ncbi:hypothetical protein FisN_4Lh297 [Fistulifera solaris]|uniref:Myb-like domain-containing protein n=1 Tax=Fistulifera solaris TaxID=1519565 RepID=A0A1Z5KDJ1_FISSO|nr:hypothetical protein FisN_4Lh297 [Fistulifera solaris]|eukprot:GAX24205.1 hypothetical protein FisN_4Lh297 [Fistulifera solaris]